MANETVLLQHLLLEIADRTASQQDADAIRLAADTLDEQQLRIEESERQVEHHAQVAWGRLSEEEKDEAIRMG
jgi:hypothetical protein